MDILSSIMGSTDTTDQHDSHLFDSNCKRCIGKYLPPTEAELERKTTKNVKISHKVSSAAPRSSRDISKEELDKVGLTCIFFGSLVCCALASLAWPQ